MLICADHPPAIETHRMFFLHHSEMLHRAGCIQRQPTREIVDLTLRVCAEGLVLVAARLHTAHHEVVLLVVQNRICILGMLSQEGLELGLDLRAVVGTREFLSDRREQIVRLTPALRLRDLQHVTKVALDGCFDGLVALDML